MKIRFTWVAAVLALLLPACEAAVDVPANRTVEGCEVHPSVEAVDFKTVEPEAVPTQIIQLQVDSGCTERPELTSIRLADGSGFSVIETKSWEDISRAVQVKFTGIEAREYIDTLILNENPSLDIVLRAVRAAKPDNESNGSFVVTPTYLNFGEMVQGDKKMATLLLKNTSDQSITIDRYDELGDHLRIVSPAPPYSVKPGAEIELTLWFLSTSNKLGAVMDSIAIVGKGQSEIITAKAMIGNYVVVTSDADFGDVRVGTTLERAVTVTNRGTGTAMISGLSIVGPDASEFTVIPWMAAFPLAVKAGESVTLALRYSPTMVHTSNATVEFDIEYTDPLGLIDDICYITARGVK